VKMQNLPRMYCYAVHHPLRKEYETICTSYTSAIWYIYSSQNRVQRSQVGVLNAQLQLQKEESDTLLWKEMEEREYYMFPSKLDKNQKILLFWSRIKFIYHNKTEWVGEWTNTINQSINQC
jgi:hypothetical protein